MTKVKLHAPVAEMHGEFEKNSGIIMRQKKYRAPNGAVLKVGVQESYKIAHPRDFDRTPAQGAELANMRSFGEVSRMTTEIIRSERYTDEELAAMTPEERAHITELRLRLENYRTRFYAHRKRLSRKNCVPEHPNSTGSSTPNSTHSSKPSFAPKKKGSSDNCFRLFNGLTI